MNVMMMMMMITLSIVLIGGKNNDNRKLQCGLEENSVLRFAPFIR